MKSRGFSVNLQFVTSYVSDRQFRIILESYVDLGEISAGVPQGSISEPVLYFLYTSGMSPFLTTMS